SVTAVPSPRSRRTPIRMGLRWIRRLSCCGCSRRRPEQETRPSHEDGAERERPLQTARMPLRNPARGGAPPQGTDGPRSPVARKKSLAPPPTKEEILEFVRTSATPVGKREIARAFQIGGDKRIWLKEILSELKREGALERGRGRRMSAPAALPEYTVLVVSGTDPDGEVLARPQSWAQDGPPPTNYMSP